MKLELVAVLLVLLSSYVAAQEKKPGERPGVVTVDAVSITATVEAIDYDKLRSI